MPLTRREMISSGLTALFLAGCGGTGRTRPRVGISFETLQTEYWATSFNLLKEELGKANVEVLEAVADGDPGRQLDDVKGFLTRGVEGVIVAPKDASMAVPIVKAANRGNTPIVFFNRPPAENSGTYTAIQADNKAISQATVKAMVEEARKLGGKYQALILLGDLGDFNALGRRDGFEEAVAEAPELIEVVARIPTDWNQEKAQSGLTAALAANPEINFIFSSSDFLFPSLVSALKSAGKYQKIGEPGHVILGGFDGDPLAYQMLVDGYLDADGVQDLFFECEQSVKAVLDLSKGEKVPQLIRDEGFVIHQGNLKEAASRMWGAQVT